ncbi:MAG: hypothetical protein AMS27_08605 [Bacteroides sp. SM23_62_1]|nr:MAG: hypothetical protein AMS27_08605 [Bacteroides sp. SM23_62_1]
MLQKAKEVANTSVNATVDFQDFRLTLFRNFPRLTVTLEGLSVVNHEPFEGDTLVAFKEFSAAVDLMSIIKGDAIRVRSILLDHPSISGIMLEDGTANWDIALPKEEEVVEEEEVDTSGSGTMDLKVALKKFEIRSAKVLYDDRSSGMLASMGNFNFTLSGDLSQEFSSLEIRSETEDINFILEGVRYLKDATLKMIFNIDADLSNSIFTLKQNSVALNALELRFDGKIGMPDEETITVDMTFSTPSTDFKGLLSMVPAVYMQDFEDIQTAGKLSLSGDIRGSLQGEKTPSANIQLLVEEARFNYPDLPKSAENINIDIDVSYDGIQNDNSTVDVNRFHVELGGNPVDFTMHMITPISDPQVNAQVTASIDFATLVDVVPMEDINLEGKLDAKVTMMGKMSSIEEEQYEDFQADGSVSLQGFIFNSPDLPKEVEIQQTTLNFSPQFVKLAAFDAIIGSSDIHMKGDLENFIPYLFSDGTVKGSLDFTSSLIDLNEFLTETEEEVEEVELEDTVVLTVIEVPGNVDFTLRSTIGKLKYDKLDIDDIAGLIQIRDQKILLTNLSMNLLEGSMVMSGEYNTQDKTSPMADFKLDISSIDIPSAFNTFNTVQRLAPVAEIAKGDVSAKLGITTFLDEHMNPVYNSLVGAGKLMSNNLEIDNSKTLQKVGDILKTDKYDVIYINDLAMNFEIRNGRVYIEPFDFNLGKSKVTLGGDQGIDQTMNYHMKMKIPKSELGAAGESAMDGLSSLAADQGLALDFGDELDVGFQVMGTFSDPQVRPVFEQGVKKISQQVKEQVTERVEEEVEKVKEEVREEVSKEAERILQDAEEQAEKIKEEARKAGEELIRLAEEEGQKRIKEAGNNPIKKVAAEEYAKRLKKEAEEKAQKLNEEADQKAEDILSKAREEADKLK